MNPHISDELPRLLTGEATRDAVLDAAEHLRSCVDCQQELVSAVVAHASLTSAQRFAREILTGEPGESLTEPSTPRVEPRPALLVADSDEPDRVSDVAPPDLSNVFAQVRAEAAAQTSSKRRPAKARYLVAAAAVVVVGAGAAVWAAESGSNGSGGGRTVALGAFGAGRTSGSAKINDDSITINASSLPTLAERRYEVWLTNDARTQMQPIGWIGADGRATLSVPDEMISRYRDLEVSVQNMKAKSYTYSGTSVLRGSLG